MATSLELPSNAKFLMENASTFSVLDNRANAHRSPAQRAFAIAVRPLMLMGASGKSTHWFDFDYLPDPEKYEGLAVPRSKNTFDVYHPNPIIYRMRLVHMSLGGWKDTALIGPDPERNDLEKLAETGWLYSYRVYGEDREIKDAQYSRLVNPGFQSTVILRGPRDFDAIGLEPETLREIPLTGIEIFKRGVRIQ